MAKQQSELGQYTTAGNWLDLNVQPFFETRSSLDWFLKRHREELVELGALIPRAGRSGSLISTELFPKAVVTILKREAQAKTRAAA